MFYQVRVPEHHANFLIYFWFNETKTDIVEYRLRVHVFGACSSPIVANYALKRTVSERKCSSKVESSIQNNFYVDDLLKFTDNVDNAINLINEIITTVSEGGLI